MPANSQATTPQEESAGLLSDIIVTAQKKNRAERVQEVPIAITALGGPQLDALKLVTVADLGATAPSVSLSGLGTLRGVVAASIRGIGTNSSIPSIEPAVGFFVDGVYLGTNFGVVLDTFDIESVEIQRGPQGTLQGRNVTGGAVMIRTQRPGKVFAVRGQASVETGPEYSVAGSVEGPVSDAVRLKLAGYYRNDRGWFTNDFTGKPFGKEQTWFLRPTIVIEPVSGVEQTFILERGRVRGDGTPTQNLANPAQTGFQINVDDTGYTRIDWKSLTSETNIDVGFGDGLITNIANYRTLLQDSELDDGAPQQVIDFRTYLNQKQLSDELRYAGRFWDRLDLTVGLFYFHQRYQYIENRVAGNFTVNRTFGGRIEQNSIGVFSQGEFEITKTLSATAGIRYSTEKKSAIINRQPTGTIQSNCNYETKVCAGNFVPVFTGGRRWSAWTPKVGLNWKPNGNTLFYGQYSQGVRNGGYNVRNTSTSYPPPYDPENVDAYEVGFKLDLLGRKLRLNGAAYINDIQRLQRDVVITAPPPETGVIQTVFNATDARYKGVEFEAVAEPVRGLTLNMSVGHVDPKYKNITLDLTGDGVIDAKDYALIPPRLSKWTYSVGVTAQKDISDSAKLTANVNYGYRSRTPANDANSFFAVKREMLVANLALDLNDNIELSIYGRNILNKKFDGFIAPLNAAQTFIIRTIEKGRSVGLQVKFRN